MKNQNKTQNPYVFALGYGTDNYEVRQEGMTLRDYFAAKAMQGIISNPNYGIFDGTNEVHIPTIKQCYEIADAMLKEREK